MKGRVDILKYSHPLIYSIILFLSIVFGIIFNEAFIFTSAIFLGIIYITFLIFRGSKISILSTVLVLIFSLRFYPYLHSMPLGVDPIRDLIYEYMTSTAGHIPLNPYRFVIYYRYFPSTQVTPLISGIVSGYPNIYSHYITLSTLLSLGSIAVYIIVKNNSSNKSMKYTSILLYGLIPSLATWGYWVIPMSFAILYSIYSILAIELYRIKPNQSLLVISFLFTILTVMTHAVVGALLLGYYILLTIVLFKRSLLKHTHLIYLFSSLGYTIIYWWLINFFNRYLFRYLRGVYNNLLNLYNHLINYIFHPYTRSKIIPVKPPVTHPVTTHPSLPPPPIRLYPDIYPWYYLIPRWIWGSLLILIPFILIVLYRHKINAYLYSTSLYGVLLGIFTVVSLFLHILWKADRYILSPASIYIIISIAGVLGYEEVRKKNSLIYKGMIFLIVILLVSSLLEPRVSFYTNPVEGDRVTFESSEIKASKFILNHYASGRIVTDYNLMTSYISYLIHTGYVKDGVKISDPYSPYYIMRRSKKNMWLFLLREYAVESSFIWNINFRNPSIIIKAYYKGHLIYSNYKNYIFVKIGL